MSILFRAVLAFLALKLGNLAINVATFPVLTGAGSARPRPTVSLLVPMRDEADRLVHTLPAILAQGVDELILLDDCSTDATYQLAETMTADHRQARVLAGAPTPPGWTGKTWACQQLGAQATSESLVFCDADVVLAPGAVLSVLAEQQRQGADLLSVFPQQQTASIGEHLLVPLVDDVLLCFLPFPLLRADVPSAATANGSLMVFNRRAYDVLGGFEAVRGDVVEDVALARLARRRGLQLGVVLGGAIVRTRMYYGYRACVTGFARGLLATTGGSRARLVLAAGWHLLAYAVPPLLSWRRPRWALVVVLGVVERLVVEAKTGRRQWWQAVLQPLSPLAALPLFVQALRRTQHWKGRPYTYVAAPSRRLTGVRP
ncbi:glycosyltransferase family 2 protein [Jatrophihabitans telluris]|uniref:Glycosyltransferase family 2 protein n=1 Tax=Jatrophihabitans telluris TaxID=2038343 RepID=A0ABY4QTU2_9ACTN|nr:glycosyltransferase family 2 protein [Jatrophihabitans telluris]UQX86858.1 glycosyltransferase family 2 protein [Jatrophihabitans telluris]